MQVDKNIHRIVHCVLNEELGVSTVVTNATLDIMNQIANQSDDELRSYPPTVNRHYPLKATNIDYEIANGVTIRLNVSIVDFDSNEELLRFKKLYPKEGSHISKAKTSKLTNDSKIPINITIVRVGGQITEGNYETLQHEVEHAFQKAMKKGELSDDRYDKNINVLSNSTNSLLRKVSRVNYLSYRHEQDAFANGLYALLYHSKCDANEIDGVIKTSIFYKTLSEMKRAVSFWQSQVGNEETEAILYNNFNYGVDVVLKRANKVVNEFIKRIGRIKALYLRKMLH